MIDLLMKKNEKEIYKVYNLVMFLIIIFQIVFLVWKLSWINGIGL